MSMRRRKAEVFLEYRGTKVYHAYNMVTGYRYSYTYSTSPDARNLSGLFDVRDLQRQIEQSGYRGWKGIAGLNPHNEVHHSVMVQFAIRNKMLPFLSEEVGLEQANRSKDRIEVRKKEQTMDTQEIVYEASDFSVFYTVKKVAELFTITPKTVRKLIRQGRLPACKVGRDFLITAAGLKRFLNPMFV